MAAIETRDILAPYVGRVVRCRGVAVKSEGAGKGRRTLVYDLDVQIHGPWIRAARHVWLYGQSLCDDFGQGSVLEFDARVHQYTTARADVVRYGVRHPRNVVRVADKGTAMLSGAVADLVAVFGWEAVADAVAAQHGEG